MDSWDRVVVAVIDRRAELGWTQQHLAEKAGITRRTIQNLEAGRRIQPLIRSRIEKALGWEQGAFRRIAEDEPERDPVPPGLREHIRDLERSGQLRPGRAQVVIGAVEAALRGEEQPTRRNHRAAEAS